MLLDYIMLGKPNTLSLKHALGPERKTQKSDNNVLADDHTYNNKTINKNPKTITNKRYQELARLPLKTICLFLTVYFKIVGLEYVHN